MFISCVMTYSECIIYINRDNNVVDICFKRFRGRKKIVVK